MNLKNSFLLLLLPISSTFVYSAEQKYEVMKNETKLMLKQAVSDSQPTVSSFVNNKEKQNWLLKYDNLVGKYIKDAKYREELLLSIHYEATRAGLDPNLIMALIYVESRFNKYSLSNAGARGLMQVMPFWVDIIGEKSHNVFYIRTNLRYGCTILKHYLEKENGNMQRALQRYNGSLGVKTYSDKVYMTMESFNK